MMPRTMGGRGLGMFREDLLKDRVIVITGGGTGLGRAMALRFADRGGKIFLVGRREQPLRETAKEIRSRGGTAGFATADVRDFNAVEKGGENPESGLGSVDTLVNSAAGNFVARTEKLSLNGFNAVVGIVLSGTFHCTLALGRRWIERNQPGTVLSIVATYASSGSGSGFVVPSACANGGCVVIEGGQWLRGAGQFNDLIDFPDEMWEALEATRKSK